MVGTRLSAGYRHWRTYLSLRARSDLRLAAEALNEAIAVDPGHPEYRLARAGLLRYRIGDYDAVKDDLSALLLDGGRSVRNRAARMLADYIWEREGATTALVETVRKALATGRVPPRPMFRYAAILNDSGRPLEAVDVVERACRSNPERVDGLGYLELLKAVTKHSRLAPRRGGLANRLIDMLDAAEGRFEELVLENADSCCIVGNAANVAGSHAGQSIDNNRLVIRVNNFPTGHPYADDYGRKLDVWVRMGFDDAVLRRPLKGLGHLVICGNNTRHRNSEGLNMLLPYLDAGVTVELVPPFVYRELLKRLGAVPSVGLATLWWAYRTLGPLRRSSAYGFSLVDNTDFVSRYPTGDVQGKLPSRHDWAAEGRLFETIFRADTSAA